MGLTEEADVRPCDDLSVTRKDTQLIVTDFIETAGKSVYDSKRLPCRSEFWLCT